MISYEYPLNERIRTLLRLEDLFRKVTYFSSSDVSFDHHTALITLFEILEVAGRADLKVDLVQELERQRQTLFSYRNNPAISEEALTKALSEIEQASIRLLAMAGKIGHGLRESEWLMSIRSRAAIPGGACQFDLPSYHFWLNQDAEIRRQNLNGWIRPMMPICEAIEIILHLLRASSNPEMKKTRGSTYQLTMAGRSAQMIRVRVSRSETIIPEISANKYALNIRFLIPDTLTRPRPSEREIQFELTFCSL